MQLNVQFFLIQKPIFFLIKKLSKLFLIYIHVLFYEVEFTHQHVVKREKKIYKTALLLSLFLEDFFSIRLNFVASLTFPALKGV